MKRLVALGLLALFIIGAGVFVWYTWPEGEPPLEVEPIEEAPIETTRTYMSETLGYSLTYPIAFVQSDHTYNFSETKDIEGGFRVTIPFEFATGTNLSLQTYLAVEQLPNANNCTGDIYMRQDVERETITEGGVEYSVASTTEDTENGQLEEWVWALADSSPCTAVRYYIVTTDEAGVTAFNRAALLAEFDGMRRSLREAQAEVMEEADSMESMEEGAMESEE